MVRYYLPSPFTGSSQGIYRGYPDRSIRTSRYLSPHVCPQRRYRTVRERVKKLIGKADDNLESAQLLLSQGHLTGTINRADYAMFDAFRTLLFVEGVFVKTHKGLQAKLYELYFATGKLPRPLSAILAKTEDLRENADYNFDDLIVLADVRKSVTDAAYVIDKIKAYLRSADLFE
ncbi:MAG: HEPN domain-containing protein [Cytophagaceae bacterium]|nr:MAG: HEPN domain-containing protein [Cytophagaceae bacterium]